MEGLARQLEVFLKARDALKAYESKRFGLSVQTDGIVGRQRVAYRRAALNLPGQNNAEYRRLIVAYQVALRDFKYAAGRESQKKDSIIDDACKKEIFESISAAEGALFDQVAQ